MPDPSKYDSADEWMSACVPAVIDEGKEQEQAVAQCLNMWRDRNKAVPALPDRAWSTLTIKSVDAEKREIEGVASTPSLDRVGDSVVSEGARFSLPLPLLHHHRHDQPIGEVYAARATKDGITIKARLAKIAEPGALRDRVDTAWGELKAGLIRGLSIGFEPIDYEPLDAKDPFGGLRFLTWNWWELSLVTIPANADAQISVVRSLDAECSAAIGETADPSPRAPRSGKSPVKLSKRKERNPMVTTSEQIEHMSQTRAAKAAQMSSIMQKSIDEGRSTDESEQDSFDDLQREVDALDKDLARLRVVEKYNRDQATPVSKDEVKTVEDGSRARAGHIQVKMPELPKGIRFARVVKAIGMAKGNMVGAVQVAQDMYPDDVPIHNILKAAIAAGSTTNSVWAGALVSAEGAVFAEFLEYLRPQTILGKFGTNGIPALRSIPFRVPIGTQTTGGVGYWVGEGAAKPLTHFEFTRTTLEPLKVANIVVVTEELLRSAAIPAETLLRDQMVAALRALLDTDFIDPGKAAAAGTSPASITNGVSTVTSSGSSADAVRADIAAVMQNFIAANNVPTSGVWVMDATTALRVSMMTNTLGQTEDFARNLSMAGGTFAGIPVIVSEYVGEFAGSPGAGYVWLISADQIFLADEGGFSVDMSREASLVMDNAPTMSSGGIGSPDAPTAAQMVSMFQTNSVAFRAERTINWMKARSTAVQGISNVQWGT